MSEELVNEWIVKSEEDYKTTEELYSKSLSEFASTICFHSQQCAEKYLKKGFAYQDRDGTAVDSQFRKFA